MTERALDLPISSRQGKERKGVGVGDCAKPLTIPTESKYVPGIGLGQTVSSAVGGRGALYQLYQLNNG